MEYEELQSLWRAYDQKLDKLEKLNKKLIAEALIKKPQKRINRLVFQNIYGMLVGPLVLIVVLHPYFKAENIDIRFIIGCVLVLFSIGNLCFIYYKGYKALQKIDLQNDSVINSVEKVSNFKNITYGKMYYIYFVSLALAAGILLIVWKGIHFDQRTITFIIGLTIFMIYWTFRKSKIHIKKIENLKKDIMELEEYK